MRGIFSCNGSQFAQRGQDSLFPEEMEKINFRIGWDCDDGE